MARPREFDTEVALKGATEIFWKQGFRATPLPDLLQAMGLTRGSFYKAFGDKQNVYLLALDYYDRCVLDVVVRRLGQCREDSAWTCLAPLFSPPTADRRGCFICNAMVELGPELPKVAARANAMAARLRDAIEGVIDHATPAGVGAENRKTADLILHLYFGHQAMGKAGSSTEEWAERLKELL